MHVKCFGMGTGDVRDADLVLEHLADRGQVDAQISQGADQVQPGVGPVRLAICPIVNSAPSSMTPS